MSGEDTMRGVGFQHAAAVLACIDGVDDERVASIVLEGGDEVIDVLAQDTLGSALWARQLKTRAEPHTWGKSDVVAILRSWSNSELAGTVPFEFATDGHLTAGAIGVAEALSDGRLTEVAANAGLPATGLRLVSIRSRVPSTLVLLEQAELHLIRRGEPFVSTVDANARVNSLLRRVLIASGAATETERTLTVDEISLHVGLLPGRLRAVAPAAAREAFATVERTALIQQALGLLKFADSHRGRVALWGFSGFGKSTLAEQIYERVTREGRKATLLRLDTSDDAHAVLSRVATHLRGAQPGDFALPALAAVVAGSSASHDLLICDNVESEDAAAVLAAGVAPRAALLITKRSPHAPPPYSTIEVGPLSTSDVVSALKNVAPGRDVYDLARYIYGWPLLLDLVRTSLRRHIASGGDADRVIFQHLSRLRVGGPPDFDNVAKATSAAVHLALESIPPSSQAAAHALGVLRTSQPQPLSLFAALWSTDLEAARSHAVALASIALVRLEGRGEIAVHDALIATLHAMLGRDERRAAHLRLADYRSLPRETAAYSFAHTPEHLAASGAAADALRLVADDEWCASVSTHLGTRLHLSRQAFAIEEILRLDEGTEISLLLTAWMLRRLYSAEFALDHRLAAIFVAVHGFELTEAILGSAGSAHEAAMAHAELAAALIKAGKIDDARRNAKAALATARRASDIDLPDTLLITVQKLGRAAPEWVRASVEVLESVIANQRDRSSSFLTRAVATSTLLPLDPDIAWQIAIPLVDSVRSAVDQNRSLEELFGEGAGATLRNVLPVIAYKDVDLALTLVDLATAEGLADTIMSAHLIAGRLLAGEEVNDAEWEELGGDDVVSLQDLVEALARRRRYRDAGRVIDACKSRRLKVRMYGSVGRIMYENAERREDVDALFEQAVATLRGAVESDLVSLLPVLASALSAYDSAWAQKLAEQALHFVAVVERPYERVTAEGSARATLAEVLPSSVDMATDELVARAGTTRPPRDAMTPRSAVYELISHLHASVVSQSELTLLPELVASRLQVGTDSPLYWARWAARLARTKDAAAASVLLDDPYFSSTVHSLRAASWATALLIANHSDAEWEATTMRVMANVRDVYRVELEVIRLVVLNQRPPDCIRRMANLGGEERQRGKLAVDAAVAMIEGRRGDALSHLLRTYLGDAGDDPAYIAGHLIVPAAATADAGADRIPVGLWMILKDTLSVSELNDAVSGLGTDTDTVFAAFLTDLLPLAVDLSVDRVEASVRSLRLPENVRWRVAVAGLGRVADVEPTSVSTWLRCQPTSDDYLSTGTSIDDWFDFASELLRSEGLDQDERRKLAADAHRRFLSLKYGTGTLPGLRVLAVVAPEDHDAAKQFIDRVTSPFLVGVATCALAGARSFENPEWTHEFMRGLDMSGTSGRESAYSIGFMLGEVISDWGSAHLRQLTRAGVLDRWPGEVGGAAGGISAMADMLTTSSGPRAILDMVGVLRDAVEVSEGF